MTKTARNTEAKALAREMRRNGETLRDIADRLHICETTAGVWCRGVVRCNGAILPVPGYKKASWNPDLDAAIIHLNEARNSRSAIAKALCLTEDQVRHRGRFLGIYRRDRRDTEVWEGMYGPEGDGAPTVENTDMLPFPAISPLGDWRWWDHGGGMRLGEEKDRAGGS